MKTGRHEGRGRPLLPPMPFPILAALNDEDIRSLFAYLQSLPPVRNRVPAPVDPPEAGAVRPAAPPRGAVTLVARAGAATLWASRRAPAAARRRSRVAPRLLSQTGLYAAGRPGVVDARNRPFSPQYPLWTDGAAKRRLGPPAAGHDD